MNGYFGIGKARHNSSYIPRLGEVILYEKDVERQVWDARIGDGKTPAKDLLPLASKDIYERVSVLEEKVAKLENDRRI
ncbi:MAG: hypothetical protein EBZ58_12680 [Bacteroidetes bacterium]|nr:hypothetical protein [Bacteroidota bacterium]